MAKFEIVMTVNHRAVIEAEDDVAAEKLAVDSWLEGSGEYFSFDSLHSMYTNEINED
jgi:hypothetical protein